MIVDFLVNFKKFMAKKIVGLPEMGFCSTNYFPRMYLYFIGRFSTHIYFRGEKKLNSFKINTLLLKNKIFTLKIGKI